MVDINFQMKIFFFILFFKWIFEKWLLRSDIKTYYWIINFQVKCTQNAACSGKPVTVMIADECPGCALQSAHFDLSGTAFGSMSNPGQANILRNAGQLNVQYRRYIWLWTINHIISLCVFYPQLMRLSLHQIWFFLALFWLFVALFKRYKVGRYKRCRNFL